MFKCAENFNWKYLRANHLFVGCSAYTCLNVGRHLSLMSIIAFGFNLYLFEQPEKTSFNAEMFGGNKY